MKNKKQTNDVVISARRHSHLLNMERLAKGKHLFTVILNKWGQRTVILNNDEAHKELVRQLEECHKQLDVIDKREKVLHGFWMFRLFIYFYDKKIQEQMK